MSTRVTDPAMYEPGPPEESKGPIPMLSERWARISKFLLIGLLGYFILALVQVFADTEDLTAAGTWAAALRLAMPIMLAGLGGLFAERAGVVNIGLEGMMIAGTWFEAWAGWMYGPWQGVAFGILGGALFGLIHAIATVTFAVDHIVSGVAINILAAGTMRFLSVITYDSETGGGATQSPRIQSSIPTFDVPLLSPFFVWLDDLEIFFISDLAGLFRGFTTGLSWLTVIALLVVPFTWWLLWRTAWGLRLRSCGENPYAAESLGVPVLRMKYWGVVISGGLAGFGGAYLVMVQAGIYREAMTGGRGFIGLATLIFGNWFPGGVLAGATVFGYADALKLRPGSAAHALLLAVAIVLGLLVIRSLLRRSYRTAAVQGVFAGLFLLWYLTTETVPTQLINALPYVVTLLVLALATQHLRMPAADGLRYRKGEAV